MSDRFEFTDAKDTEAGYFPPGSEIGEDTVRHGALMFGNPWATALVVEGTPDQLRAFLDLAMDNLNTATSTGPEVSA